MVLEDYKRDKKKLINPFDAKIPMLNKVSYVEDTFPNIFWIALLYESKGLESSIDLIDRFMGVIDKVTNKRIKGLMYEFFSITDEEWVSIREKIDKATLKEIKESLACLLKMYPQCPFNKLFDEVVNVDEEKSSETLLKVGAHLSYKPSKTSSLSMGMFVDSLIKRGILQIQQANIENFDIMFLEKNWDSEKAKRIRPSIRATIIMFLDKTKRNVWSEYFWKRGFEISNCDDLLKYYKEKDGGKYLGGSTGESFVKDFVDIIEKIESIHQEVFNLVKYSPNKIDELEIKLGLVNRIFSLSDNLLKNPPHWNGEVGRMILRSIIDSYFLLVWFQTKAKPEDLINYRDYGLGKKKLFFEHLKSNARNDELNSVYEKLAEELDEELMSRINPIFLDVNIGDWKAISERDIAIEIGEKDIFDYFYNPFSDIVHGGYSSLEHYHLRYCYNPLHKGHKIPKSYDDKLEVLIPILCLQILIKFMRFIEGKLNLNINKKTLQETKELYDKLIKKILPS